MNRIPIIIQGALSRSGGSGGVPVVSGEVEYSLSWNEETQSLELRNNADDTVQTIPLTGIIGSGGSGGSIDLEGGYRIQVENFSTGKTVVSYVPGDDEITAEKVREIIEGSNLASKNDIPTKLSDLTNDSGFIGGDNLASIQNSISTLNGRVSEAENNITALEGETTGIKETLTVSPNIGQLPVGKEYPPGTTLTDIIKDILDPAMPPTITEPRLSISGTESGVDILSGQTKNATITLTFNRGTISSGGNTVGAAIEYSLNGGAYQASNVFNVTVSESNKTFKGKVKYGEGDQAKDSKGDDYGTPREAGELESGTITYKFVTPAQAATLWSNAANIMNVVQETGAKESLKQYVFHWCPQTEANPEIFDVPATWNLLKIETINDLNGQWESVAHNFVISDVTHNGIAYKRYTDDREFDDDGRDIRLTWQ